ncbi:MAG: manganese efflux pump MntP family protein [Erysipelotrichaceae bacterium]
MSFIELILIAVGLSMDAFSVAICKGLSIGKINWRHMTIVGLWFGIFQGLMPVIGYFGGSYFTDKIGVLSDYVAFALLFFIGANMIKEAIKNDSCCNSGISFMQMFPLAVATSIDALAAGISFAFLKVNIWYMVLFIGLITFSFSALGVKIGSRFGEKYKTKAEILGGVVLILIAIKTLL